MRKGMSVIDIDVDLRQYEASFHRGSHARLLEDIGFQVSARPAPASPEVNED
jgi:hypothetical protein